MNRKFFNMSPPPLCNLMGVPRDLKEIAQDLEETTPEPGETAQGLDKTTQELGEITQGLDETTQELGETTQELGETTQELGETTQESEEITLEIGGTTRELEETTLELGATPPEPGEIIPDFGEKIEAEYKGSGKKIAGKYGFISGLIENNEFIVEIMEKAKGLFEKPLRTLPDYNPEIDSPLVSFEVPDGLKEIERYWIQPARTVYGRTFDISPSQDHVLPSKEPAGLRKNQSSSF